MKKKISNKTTFIYITILVFSILFFIVLALNYFFPELFKLGNFTCQRSSFLIDGLEPKYNCGWIQYLINNVFGFFGLSIFFAIFGLPYLLIVSAIIFFVWWAFLHNTKTIATKQNKKKILLKIILLVLYIYLGSILIGAIRIRQIKSHSINQFMSNQIEQITPSAPSMNQGLYSNKKYGFEFKHLPSQCLLAQKQTSGFYIELYQDGQCPTIEERGYLNTLTFKYNYDLISVVKSDLSTIEYVKEKFKFSRIKTQKSIRINNIDWEAINLDCDINEGEPSVCKTFYISKNNKSGFIYSITSRDENSAESIAKEWINL